MRMQIPEGAIYIVSTVMKFEYSITYFFVAYQQMFGNLLSTPVVPLGRKCQNQLATWLCTHPLPGTSATPLV
jgi:hypothetical protein